MNVITNDSARCSEALTALQQVKDPEIGLNIVDLGLVYQLDVDSLNATVYLQMTLTTQFCPMGSSIVDLSKKSLQQVFPGYEVIVSLTFEPRWSTARISAEGKLFLNK